MIKKLVLIIACILLFSCKSYAAATEGIFWISGSNVVMTGSIDVTGDNVNVPGSGTAYTTELGVGSDITVSTVTRTIATITNDTTATVTSTWGSDLANDTSPEIVPYATLNAFEADLAATLTDDLTVYHRDEETACASDIVFDLDTATFLLKITAEPGAEHSGAVYGNGARINFSTNIELTLDEAVGGTLNNVEFSNLAFDISGVGNDAFVLADGGDTGLITLDRLLIAGDGDSGNGVNLSTNNIINVLLMNSAIYGLGSARGIDLGDLFSSGRTHNIYNNTVTKCSLGILQDRAGALNYTLNLKNNLCQGNTTDYRDDGAGYTATAKNISEDATSPDVSYRSKDLHTNSVFLNYASNDYRLDSSGDVTNLAIVDDGENLFGSGVTEDIAGTARDNGTPFWIGASHITAAAGGGPSIQSLLLKHIIR